jgi:hypothetical protein
MDKNTPKGKGFRTAYQAVAGTVLAYFTGLFALPSVREYTTGFIHTQGIPTLLVVLAAFGVGAGAVSFVQNKLDK